MSEEKKPKKLEDVPPTPQPQRPFVPGYEQPCNNCIFRDFYEMHKTAKDQSTLLGNMRNQLIAITGEYEKLKESTKPEGAPEEPTEP